MKKIKLHKWSAPAVILILLFVSCSRKTFSESSSNTEDRYEPATINNSKNYTPPPVISIPDEKARTNKEGELYYDDANGYRYWRYCDGKYYLDKKYDTGSLAKKKKSRKKPGKKVNSTGPDEYATNE
ncbi:MAG: hypothetical protein U0V75_05290 [Ferruginibacter sp.]